MSVSDSIFNNLRQKLDVFGYKQLLPLGGIPLVGALFEDLIKTTESLRDAKKALAKLLEEKSCWELGVEPYKCDNQRLLTECNQLHMQLMKQQEEFEKDTFAFNHKIRNLETDKLHLEEQCKQLEYQIQTLLNKQNSGAAGMGKEALTKSKKPFVTVVGPDFPPLQPLQEHASNIRCTKCNITGCTHRDHAQAATKSTTSLQAKEIITLENKIKDLEEQLALHKERVGTRDREIMRLNDLLCGGRPPEALAKDCCYNQVGALAKDLEVLQREKTESLNQMRSYQDQMHEAMQRALKLEAANRQLRTDLEEFKKAALQIEQQANSDVAKSEREVEKLKLEIRKLMQELKKVANAATTAAATAHKRESSRSRERSAGNSQNNKADNKELLAMNAAEKRRYQEQLNALTQRESELKACNMAMHKKMHKLKSKLMSMRKELKDNAEEKRNAAFCDEEKIRLKSERDFYQKEYLRLVSKTGSEKEVDFLQQQIKSKDEELRLLRTELCLRPDLNIPSTPPTDNCQQQQCLPATADQLSSRTTSTTVTSARSEKQLQHSKLYFSASETNCESARGAAGDCHSNLTTAHLLGNANCVQAAVLRAERERDVIRAEMERLRCERDTLREKHVLLLQQQHEESRKMQQCYDELNARIRELERENREANSARLPSATQNVLLKEKIEELRDRLTVTQEENRMLKSSYSQIKILQEQTERSLLEYQNKLTLAEHQLESTEMQLNTLDSNRETSRAENVQLRSEISALKQTYITLEHEKDMLLSQLDTKTQRACEFEFQLKACREKRDDLETRATELEHKLEKLTRDFRERNTELNEKANEAKKLRQQLDALIRSRDEAIAENGGLIDNCSDIKADNQRLRKEIEEHTKENEALKKKITQYVQEIRRTEDLLLRKEKEREEVLEQYRSLSQDTVALQGNNLSLEEETAEYKRQVVKFEQEVAVLKAELKHRNAAIDELEAKIATLRERNVSLQHCLDEANEEKRLIKLDLKSRIELCKRLEDERTKLNAEIDELNKALRMQTDKAKSRQALDRENVSTATAPATSPAAAAAASADEMISRVYELELQNARLDLVEQLRMDQRLNEELARLRQKNEHILEELDAAQRKNLQSEKLIHEYFVQNQELRHNLTDDRFREARMREQNKQRNVHDDNTMRRPNLPSRALSPILSCTSRTSPRKRHETDVGAAGGTDDGNGAGDGHSHSSSAATPQNTPEYDVTKHADSRHNVDDDASLIADDATLTYRRRTHEKTSTYPFHSKTM